MLSSRWYLSPFVRNVTVERPTRYCLINDQADRIATAGGTLFQDVEVLGNQGLVLIHGPAAVHDALSAQFIQLPALGLADSFGASLLQTDRASLKNHLNLLSYDDAEIKARLRTIDLSTVRFGEYLNFMRTRRKTPRYDPSTDAIILDGPAQTPNPLPIQVFATFPTTGILDNFNRANENPLDVTLWPTQPIYAGDGKLQIQGNEMLKSGASSWGGGAWHQTFAANQEVYITISTLGTGTKLRFALDARVQNPGTSTYSAYSLIYNDGGGGDKINMYRIDNTAYTQLGASLATGQVYVVGDKVGFELNGSALSGYHYDSTTTTWSLLGSRTDTTYNLSSQIGYEHFSNKKCDDFSGGVVVVASTAYNSMLLTGVGV